MYLFLLCYFLFIVWCLWICDWDCFQFLGLKLNSKKLLVFYNRSLYWGLLYLKQELAYLALVCSIWWLISFISRHFCPKTHKTTVMMLESIVHFNFCLLNFLYLTAVAVTADSKNWPPFFPIIHHDIANEIPVHAQKLQYLAFASWLGMYLFYSNIPLLWGPVISYPLYHV